MSKSPEEINNEQHRIGEFIHTPNQGAAMELGKQSDTYVHLKDLPDYVGATFVAAEDARFYEHEGFDLRQIKNSLEVDLESGKMLRGGSTISQQLAKNLFLHRKRTVGRKLQEAVLTWRIEELK